MFSSRILRGHFGLVGLVASSLLVLIIVATDVEAKRGCFAYGHSCLGGLGKRAEAATAGVDDPGEDAVEVEQAVDGRRAVGRFDGQDGGMMMAWPWQEDDNGLVVPTGGRQMQRQLTPQQLYQLTPFLRQLLRNVRTNQDVNVANV